MKKYRRILPLLTIAAIAAGAFAQVESGSGVRRRTERDRKRQESSSPGVTDRMQGFFETSAPHEADLEYMRQIYRQIDLQKDANTPLYFPEDVVDGQENLFRVIFRLVTDGTLPAYEYLDGREVFSDKYKINVAEMLDRFGIYYTQAGSSERNRKYTIEEADVPTGQVLNYYIIEKWEFDRRTNKMRTRVEAICPVLNRSGDFGGEARYPMFWVKFDQLRPYLSQQYIFLDDDNNLARYSLDDYFNLGMYDGEIYKTRNLKNLSMVQMYPDPDDLKRAQDSIDNRLNNYGKHLWVPTREEYLAQKEAEEERARLAAAGADTLPERTVALENEPAEKKPAASAKRSTKKRSSTKSKSKVKRAKEPSGNSNSNSAKSVRRRRR